MSDELMQMIRGYGVLRYRMGCSTASTSESIAKEAALLLTNISDHIATLEASVAANQKDAWQPISSPPPTTSGSSVCVLGVLEDGGIVFALYTPFYLGRDDEEKMLWTCQLYGYDTKPTHWMPLPVAPDTSTQEVGCQHQFVIDQEHPLHQCCQKCGMVIRPA